jgi:hypothetical protein
MVSPIEMRDASLPAEGGPSDLERYYDAQALSARSTLGLRFSCSVAHLPLSGSRLGSNEPARPNLR